MHRCCWIVLALCTLCLFAADAVDHDQFVLKKSDIKALKAEALEMFKHGFQSYMKYAFPEDELKPLSCAGRRRGRDPSRGTMDNVLGRYSLTLIDSLDSLAVMGLRDEFKRAVHFVSTNVSFDTDLPVSIFEVTIRVLGGLLSAHLIASDPYLRFTPRDYTNQLLVMAENLGKRLLPAFRSPTGIPYPLVNLRHGHVKGGPNEISLAEAGTLQLEFFALSALTGNPVFKNVALATLKAILARKSPLGLYGGLIDVNTGIWMNVQSGIGAGFDSFYEYLLKLYVLTGDVEYWQWWSAAREALRIHSQSRDGWFLNVNSINGQLLNRHVDALMAFFPGTLAQAGELDVAVRLHANFHRLWRRCGLMPENYNIQQLNFLPNFARGYPLRPEHFESTYLLYRATRDPLYLQLGKEMMQQLQKHTRVECGYAAVEDLTTLSSTAGTKLEDRMDSFFLSETLKYLYLLFDEENFVHQRGPYLFTTEGHLLPLLSLSGLRPNASVGQNSSHVCEAHYAPLAEAPSVDLPPLHEPPSTPPHPASPVTQPRIEFVVTSHLPPDGEVPAELPVQYTIQVVDPRHHNILFETPAAGATFGDVLLDRSLEAPFSVANPLTACSALANTDTTRGSFVLVSRGDCLFVEKTRVAQRAGAAGIVIFDNQATSILMTMSAVGAPADGLSIPAFFITRESGTKLQTLLAERADPITLRVAIETLPGRTVLQAMPQQGVAAPPVVTYIASGLQGMELNFDAIFEQLLQSGQLTAMNALQTLELQFDPQQASEASSTEPEPPLMSQQQVEQSEEARCDLGAISDSELRKAERECTQDGECSNGERECSV